MEYKFEKWHMDNNPNYVPISDTHLDFIISYCEYIYPIVVQYLTEDFMKEVFDKKGKMLNGRGKLTSAHLWVYNPIAPSDETCVLISMNSHIYKNEEEGRCEFKSKRENNESMDSILISNEMLNSYEDFSRILVHEFAHLIDCLINDSLMVDTSKTLFIMWSEVVAFYCQGKFRGSFDDNRRETFYRIFKRIYVSYDNLSDLTLQDLFNQISKVAETVPRFVVE